MLLQAGRKKLSAKTIDEIDAKILNDLLRDGRKKFTTIAKEAQVSKDVIFQHYSRMKKKRIIIGATVLVDYKALGRNVNASITLKSPIAAQKLVIEQLSAIPGLYDVYQWGSSSRLWAVLHLKDTQEIENVKQFIKKILFVTDMEIEIWVGTRNLLTNLSALSTDDSSTDTNNRRSRESGIKTGSISLDELDRQIIEQLVYNGRLSFSNIAKITKSSTATIMRRCQKLAQNNIVKPIIQINPSKIGYPASAGFRLTANGQDDFDKIADAISKIPDVINIYKTIGMYDFTVFACVKNLQHLIDLENQIGKTVGIQEVEKATVVSLKLGYLPFPALPISTF